MTANDLFSRPTLTVAEVNEAANFDGGRRFHVGFLLVLVLVYDR